MSTFPSQFWILSGVGLGRSCVCCQCLRESMSISPAVLGRKMLFPWCHLPPLAITIFSSSLLQESLSPEGRGLIKTSHLGLSAWNHF